MPESGKTRGKMNRRGVYQYKGKQVFHYWITIPRKIKQESRIKTNTVLRFQAVPGYITIMSDENNENQIVTDILFFNFKKIKTKSN